MVRSYRLGLVLGSTSLCHLVCIVWIPTSRCMVSWLALDERYQQGIQSMQLSDTRGLVTKHATRASRDKQQRMDFLLASLAPSVLPGLQRSLEVAFLAGLVTSKKLLVAQTPVARLHGLPKLPQRQRQGPLQNLQQVKSVLELCQAHACRC